jgi:Zn-dependent peptidase ImmA (M78 family)
LNDYIIKRSTGLIKKYKTRNPFEIAASMNIDVLLRDLGNLKGFYKRDGHNRFIVINDKLNESFQKIVCAHELGHDQLHRHLTKSHTLQEFAIYDMKCKPEYEANLFAAEILLPAQDVLSLFHLGYSFYETASLLDTDIHLLAIKLMIMNKAGYNLNIPVDLKSDFLGE